MNIKRIIAVLSVIILIATSFAACKDEEDKEAMATVKNTITASESQTQNTTEKQTNNITAQSTTEAETQVQTTQRQIVSVTIPEGYSFMQIANKLEEKGVCSAKDFYETAQSYSVKSFSVPSSSDRCFKFEGYLFPDTYEFYKDDDPQSVLIKMLNNYAAKSGMPTDKQLIIASIIEKETRSDSHMKMVSSVFYNRLNEGMLLQADSTREYVNNYITGNSLLSGNTSKYAALYNTYKCQLPAGPICSPGARAIEAAKNPSSSEYLYYFFGNDNDNHYSKTYEEHEQQMKKYGVQYGN